MRTLVVNLFVGPNGGKSTIAPGVWHFLKRRRVRSEYVNEAAKWYTWKEDYRTLRNQVYVTAEQFDHILTLDGQVDVIITDGPILLGIVYPGVCCTPSWEQHVLEMHNHFWNLNVWIERPEDQEYDPVGRRQTEEESLAKDAELLEMLSRHGIECEVVQLGDGDVEAVLDMIFSRLRKQMKQELIGKECRLLHSLEVYRITSISEDEMVELERVPRSLEHPIEHTRLLARVPFDKLLAEWEIWEKYQPEEEDGVA